METWPKPAARVHLRIFQCKRKQRKITNEKISMKLKKYDDTFIASETITMAVPSTQYTVPCPCGLTGRTWIVGLASWLRQRGMRLQRTSVWLEGAGGVIVCVCVCEEWGCLSNRWLLCARGLEQFCWSLFGQISRNGSHKNDNFEIRLKKSLSSWETQRDFYIPIFIFMWGMYLWWNWGNCYFYVNWLWLYIRLTIYLSL